MRPMSHRLVILRHSKSSWAEPEPDHARPLNKRGHRDGKAAGQWLAENIGPVDHVLCSTATRTRLTWERAQAGGAVAKDVHYHDEIYETEVSYFEHLILRLPESVGTALFVGHWPGVVELAHHLGAEDEHPGWAQMDKKFPTSAIAVLEFDTPWKTLADDLAQLTDFVIPRG
ncbi:histidine phosphatase family protein [Corynebacterium sp. Sa1YVA5]|uniref:Histidine phosphatase family protein n=2 Tax=Corynebacterium gallinarum TaxID=2762214 RepID=A0A8I0LFJ6_9CORY|nr:histidine phosphatase family protein [Corynebacterium gallinarum]